MLQVPLALFHMAFLSISRLYTLCYCNRLNHVFTLAFILKIGEKYGLSCQKTTNLKFLIELSHPALVFSVDRAKCFPRCLTHGDAVRSRTRNTPKVQ